jgi:sugar O-acyltransferase (sialic acid O-acetyltransferase NeuD family)
VIYGLRSGYAAEVVEIVWRLGWSVAALIDNLPDGPSSSTLGPVFTPATTPDSLLELPLLIALLTPGHRAALETEARGYGWHVFPALVDPTAVVARTSAVGDGTIVNAASVIGAGAVIGRFVHVNRSASIAHDVGIRDFATLGPGCVLAGSVSIERGAFIGAGAVVAPGVRIGANSIVGAGAVVVRDVADNVVVAGNPARTIREGIPGYGDTGV